MDVPAPTDVPIRKIRDYLSNLRDAILGIRPVAGNGITVAEHPGQGTIISVDNTFGLPGVTTPSGGFSTITLDVCVGVTAESHTFVITS